MSLPQLTGKLVFGFYFSCPQRNYLYKFSPCSVTGHCWHHLKAHCIALWCSRCSLNNIQCCVHFPNHSHLSHTLHCSDTHLNNSLYLKQSKIIFTWQVHCMHCVATTISGIFRILNYASNDIYPMGYLHKVQPKPRFYATSGSWALRGLILLNRCPSIVSFQPSWCRSWNKFSNKRFSWGLFRMQFC